MTNQDPSDKVEKKPEHSVTTSAKDSAITKGADQDVVLKEQEKVAKNRDKMPSGLEPALHQSFGIIDAVDSRSIDKLEALGTPESKQFADMRREIRRQLPPGQVRDKVETETKKAIEDVLKAGQRAHTPSDLDGGIHKALGLVATKREVSEPESGKPTITVHKGDTIDIIASFVLGKHAPASELKSYSEQIAKTNHISDLTAKLHPGDRLVLPPSRAVLEATKDHSEPKTDGSLAEPNVTSLEQQRVKLLQLSGDRGLSLADNMRQIESMHRPEESSETFKHVNRILSDNSDTPLTLEQKKRIAEQIIDQAAHPTSIDQGQHNTCNVATIETRTYTRTPSIAAKLVADVVLDGKFVSPHGVTADVSPYTFDSESSDTSDASKRTHASEIFQRTAVNLHYQLANRYTHRNFRYIQLQAPGGDDTGERLMDYSSHPHTQEKHPNLEDRLLCEISNLITGKSEKGLVICNERYTCGKADSQITQIGSEHELAEAIKHLKAEHKLPVVLRVDCNNEPFFTDSGGGIEGGSDGAHFVTVRDIVGSPPRVMIDNQWGDRNDHLEDGIPLHDLYIATLGPRLAAAELRKDVMHNRNHGHIDSYKEFDLVRLQFAGGIIPNETAFEREIKSVLVRQAALWEQQDKHGHLNEADKAEALSKVDTLIENGLHSLTEKAKVRTLQHSLGLLSDDTHEIYLVEYGKVLSTYWKSAPKENHAFREFLKSLPKGQGAKILKEANLK